MRPSWPANCQLRASIGFLSTAPCFRVLHPGRHAACPLADHPARHRLILVVLQTAGLLEGMVGPFASKPGGSAGLCHLHRPFPVEKRCE